MLSSRRVIETRTRVYLNRHVSWIAFKSACVARSHTRAAECLGHSRSRRRRRRRRLFFFFPSIRTAAIGHHHHHHHHRRSRRKSDRGISSNEASSFEGGPICWRFNALLSPPFPLLPSDHRPKTRRSRGRRFDLSTISGADIER